MLRKKVLVLAILGAGLVGCNGGDGGGSSDVSQQSLTFETKYDLDKNSPLLAEYDVYYGTIQLYGSKTNDSYVIDSYSYIIDDGNMVVDVENTANGQIISSEDLGLRIETDNNGVIVHDYSNDMTWNLSADQLIDLGLSAELFKKNSQAIAQSASQLTSSDVSPQSNINLSERIHFSVSQCSQPFEGVVTASLPQGFGRHKIKLMRMENGFQYVSTNPFVLEEQLVDDAFDRISNLKELNPESCGVVDEALGYISGKVVSDMNDFVHSDPENYSKIREHLENHSNPDIAKHHSYGFLKVIGAIEAISKTRSVFGYATESDTGNRLKLLRNATSIFDTTMCLTKDTKFDSILPGATLNQGFDTAIIVANTLLSKVQEAFSANSSGTVGLYVTARNKEELKKFRIEFNPDLPENYLILDCKPKVEIDVPPTVYIDRLAQINLLFSNMQDNSFVKVKAKSIEGSLGDEPPAPSENTLDKEYNVAKNETKKEVELPPVQTKSTQVIEVKMFDKDNKLLDTDIKTVQVLPEPIDCGSVDLVINQQKTYSDASQYCSSVGMTLLNSSQVKSHRGDLQQCLDKYDWVWLSGSSLDASTAFAYAPENNLTMPWGTWREMVVACTR